MSHGPARIAAAPRPGAQSRNEVGKSNATFFPLQPFFTNSRNFGERTGNLLFFNAKHNTKFYRSEDLPDFTVAGTGKILSRSHKTTELFIIFFRVKTSAESAQVISTGQASGAIRRLSQPAPRKQFIRAGSTCGAMEQTRPLAERAVKF